MPTTETLTWKDAADWGNATSESGVVHESVTNTDHDNDAILKMGFSAESPFLSTEADGFWPLQEDSGSTAYDFGSGSNNGTLNGPSPGAQGLLSTTAYEFVTSENDNVSIGSPFFSTANWTMSAWFNTTGITWNSNREALIGSYDGSMPQAKLVLNSEDVNYESGCLRVSDSTDSMRLFTNDAVTDGSWHLLTATRDGDTFTLYLDGQEVDSKTNSSINTDLSNDFKLGSRADNEEWYGGLMANARRFSKTLSQSEIQTMYDIVAQPSTLTTASRSFTEPVEPDLVNLDYTLNSQSITLTVIGSPGTADEEQQVASLDGSTSFALSWVEPHQDFQIKVELSTSDVTTTPTVNSINLEAETGTTRTVVWKDNADWSASQSTEGVVFENTTNTDHDDADTVKRGYPIADPVPADPYIYWPMHEDGGQANDFGTSGNDGTVADAVTQGNSGLIDTTSYGFDSSSYVQVGNFIPDTGLLHEFDARQLSSAGTFDDEKGTKSLTSNGSPSLISSGIGSNQTMRYDGADDEHVDGSVAALGASGEYTAALVYQYQSLAGDFNGVLNNGTSGSSGYLFREEDGNDQYNWTHTGIANNTGGSPDTTAHILVASYDGSNLVVEIDDVEIVNKAVNLNTPSGGFALGSENGNNYGQIDIGHHLHYDQYYDSNGRTDIYDALKSEWGL